MLKPFSCESLKLYHSVRTVLIPLWAIGKPQMLGPFLPGHFYFTPIHIHEVCFSFSLHYHLLFSATSKHIIKNSSFTSSNPDGDVCSSTTQDGGARGMGNQNGASAAAVLNNAQIANRMKSIFETSLKLHLTGQYMQVIISSKHLVRTL